MHRLPQASVKTQVLFLERDRPERAVLVSDEPSFSTPYNSMIIDCTEVHVTLHIGSSLTARQLTKCSLDTDALLEIHCGAMDSVETLTRDILNNDSVAHHVYWKQFHLILILLSYELFCRGSFEK